MSDQEKNSIPGMLNIKTKEEQVGEVSESKKEQQFYLQANKLEEIKKEYDSLLYDSQKRKTSKNETPYFKK